MGQITDDGNQAFRDYVTDGVPSSGAHEPVKSDIRALFDLVDSTVAGVGGGSSGAVTVYNRGTITTGTETPSPGDSAMQKAVNNGAHTLAAPTVTGAYVLTYTNGASAGAITASGWDRVDDADSALAHTVVASVVECAAYNDGVSKRLIVTLIEDAT